ncbi:MAG: hypothetical protein D6754_02660 [Alphaproteobacteria bacterium]|nr:MAG: hypothetical protein D6754_02660 [Alphaproteobacteria bacterium]
MQPDAPSWAFRPVDIYCERLGPGFWAEPVNAVSNLAFIIAALIMLFPALRARDPGAIALVAILELIGIGSFLWHTFAVGWAGPADVIPIAAFILLYVWLATRRFFDASPLRASLAVIGALAVLYLTGAAIRAGFGSLNGSEGYAGVLVLLAAYAAALMRAAPATARGLLLGAALLALSLTFRSLDATLCGAFPLGTHFLWHILNAVMLGWMIHVLLAHPRALARTGSHR